MSSPEEAAEVRRAIQLIEALLRGFGLTKKDLDERLGASRGYHGQLLSGRFELKYVHVLSILRALGIPAGQFFRALFPTPIEESAEPLAEDRLLDRLRALGFPPTAPDSASGAPTRLAPSSGRDLELRIRELVEQILAERSEGAG